MNTALARFILNTLIALSAMNSQAVTNNKCKDLFAQPSLYQNEKKQSEQAQAIELQKTQNIIAKNSFTTARSLQEYISYLKLNLVLRQLDSTKRWLDAGAGRARAQLQFLELKKNNPESLPELVALSYKKPWFVTSKKERFKYLEGRFIEDYKPSELGFFDLITDLYGPFSYSKDPIAVLNKYLQLLSTQGTLKINFSSLTSGIWADGQLLPLEKWLSQQMSTPEAKAIFETEIEHGLISVRRINNQPFLLPKINLILFSSDAPPHRKYQIDSEPVD